MRALVRDSRTLSATRLVAVLVAWAIGSTAAIAGDGPIGYAGSHAGEQLLWPGQPPHPHDSYGDGAGEIGGPIGPIGHLNTVVPLSHSVLVNGTLGYGPPGLWPGFYGFSLGYHLGYGYGGNALGVGCEGGYPCYGGPGYPIHYGYPHFAYPYYQGVAALGPLVPDTPVVRTDLPGALDFGPYTGASQYAYVHPSYAAEAAATGSFVPGARSYPDTGATNPIPEATYSAPASNLGTLTLMPVKDRYLGMDQEPVVLPDGKKGLKIVKVLPGSTAERAGLEVGDVIVSINGYYTEQRSHIGWVISNAASDKTLKMTVKRARDGKEEVIDIKMP